MADRRLRVQDRVAALDKLEAVAFELNAIATWLGEAGVEAEADMVEQSAQGLLASCWLLSRRCAPSCRRSAGQTPE